MDREPVPHAAGAAGAGPTSLTLKLCMAACRLQARLATRTARSGWRARWLDSSQFLLGSFFNAALTTAEKSRLTIEVYDVHPTYREVPDRLEPWEERWFEQRLPAAPATILVGGCGTGREVTALARRGYAVVGLEPAPAFVATSRERVARVLAEAPHLPRSTILRLTYEQLSARVLDRSASGDAGSAVGDAAGIDEGRTFDAIVLGCGSLSHILDPNERVRLMHALNRLCPAGPILVSFADAATDNAAPHVGYAARVGTWTGRTIGRLRGLVAGGDDHLGYGAYFGFAHRFSTADIETLARAAGRSAQWERDEGRDGQQSNYATLLVKNGTG